MMAKKVKKANEMLQDQDGYELVSCQLQVIQKQF